eukprot:10490891-Alexandrium_andersonii.AAC.1
MACVAQVESVCNTTPCPTRGKYSRAAEAAQVSAYSAACNSAQAFPGGSPHPFSPRALAPSADAWPTRPKV